MRKSVIRNLSLLIALLALISMPVTAQVSGGMNEGSPYDGRVGEISIPPNQDDEICDGDEQSETVILDCFVTKATTDLDSPISGPRAKGPFPKKENVFFLVL